MASKNGSPDHECGTLHVFPDLPDHVARDAFVASTLDAMQEAVKTLDPALPGAPLKGTVAQLWFDPVKAQLAATRDLAVRMKAARDGGDARGEDRLFRSIVIAKWLGDALSKALRPVFGGPGWAALSRLTLVGGKTLELVAQTGHSRVIRRISFSAEGSRLITASDDRRAISWAAATGDRRNRLTALLHRYEKTL